MLQKYWKLGIGIATSILVVGLVVWVVQLQAEVGQLQAELDDLNGSRQKRIANDGEATNLILWSALAAELEHQADRLESVVPAQQKKEAEALSRLENLI
jgi:hypothetical protein